MNNRNLDIEMKNIEMENMHKKEFFTWSRRPCSLPGWCLYRVHARSTKDFQVSPRYNHRNG